MAGPIFLDRPKAEFPKHVSSAFYELERFIKSHQTKLDPEMQEILFCIAYTKYCREKKDFVNGQIDRGIAKPEERSIIESHPQFCSQERFLRYCEEAEEIIERIKEHTSGNIISNITGTIVTAVRSDIMVPIDAVKDDIHALRLELAQQHKMSLKKFFREAAFHSITIVVAAAIIFFAAKFSLFIAPMLGEIARKYLGPILDSWGLT